MSYEDRISIATPEGVDLQLTLAGLGSRFVASILDQLIRWAIILAVMVVLAVGTDAGGLDRPDEGAGLAVAVFVAVLFLVQFVYDVVFETFASGRTPGKRWTGLRVVTVTGAPVGFLTSAVRNMLRLVDVLPGVYAVGMAAVLASRHNQRLGDMAAGTLVVRERRGAPSTARHDAPATASPLSPRSWDVSGVSADELATVRRFLERRSTLSAEARHRLAGELALRLRPKVVGPREEQAPEAFLEELSNAKAARL